MSDFKRNIIDLFSGKRGGHVQKYLYGDVTRPDSSTGSGMWNDFVTSSHNYYTIQRETDLIPKLLERVGVDYDTVVDFGVGNEKAIKGKLLPILKVQSNLRNFCGVSYSRDELNEAIPIIQQEIPRLDTQKIEKDFYKPISGIHGDYRLGLLFGGTITNQEMRVGDPLPRDLIVQRLRTLGDTVRGDGKRGDLVISLDTNPDLNDASAAYLHPSWVRMMTGLMYDVADKLNPQGNFSPSLWHYVPFVDEENFVVHHCVSPSVDQKFSIDGQEFDMKAGEKFVAINTFKFPLPYFLEMVRDAGLETREPVIQDNAHPMVFVEAYVG